MATDQAPFEFLWLVKESAYGTTKVTPTAGVDSMYIRLAGANRYKMRPMPTRRKIIFGGGLSNRGYAVSDQLKVEGGLELELCYSQAKMLLDWSVTKINGAQTIPWTTTEPIADLASCTVYHATARNDGTYKRLKYLGTKVHSAKLASSPSTGLTMLSLGLMAQKHVGNVPDASADPVAAEFAVPADTAFPVDAVLFNQLTCNAAATPLTFVQGAELSIGNDMDPRYFAGSQFISFDRFRGRTSTANLDLLLTATPNWRTKLESITSEALTFSWTNGTNTILVDYLNNNLIDGVNDDLSPGKVYNVSVSYESQYSTSSSGDVVFTFT